MLKPNKEYSGKIAFVTIGMVIGGTITALILLSFIFYVYSHPIVDWMQESIIVTVTPAVR